MRNIISKLRGITRTIYTTHDFTQSILSHTIQNEQKHTDAIENLSGLSDRISSLEHTLHNKNAFEDWKVTAWIKQVDQNLIFDIGVNDGLDSHFYLKKGFRVIGVEANPDLAYDVASKFSEEISSGQYTLLNIGLWNEKKILPFYKNMDNSHWSSFDPVYGCRNNTNFEVIDIQCFTILDLINSFGIPRYMKIDVEGADKLILLDLRNQLMKPIFISVEEYGVNTLHDLRAAGYKNFAVLPQRNKNWCYSRHNDLEGRHVDWKFNGLNTGIFGNDIQGVWLNFQDAVDLFTSSVRKEDRTYVGEKGEWHDVHARLF
ncbi:FkbM family methyltransferase [Brucella cytisi]|uniref:FkbM family methyltransferase n=1 Tax=Brucella cytisi TaxID=407152 RepID=UPI00313D3AC8